MVLLPSTPAFEDTKTTELSEPFKLINKFADVSSIGFISIATFSNEKFNIYLLYMVILRFVVCEANRSKTVL